MQHGDPVAEPVGKATDGLRGQGDLRHQHDCLPAERKTVLDRF